LFLYLIRIFYDGLSEAASYPFNNNNFDVGNDDDDGDGFINLKKKSKIEKVNFYFLRKNHKLI
jgi:hypothetical protein